MAAPYTVYKNPNNLICFIGFLDLLGVSMVLPLLQPYIMQLGVSATVAGVVGSIYGFLQIFSSPVMGEWSDLVGRRYALIVSLSLCGVSYALMGASFTVVILALCRIPLGLFKHSQMLCRAYLSQTVAPRSVPAMYGRFNAVSVLGFIVGPAISGHIFVRFGFLAVAMTTGFVFLLNAAIAWCFLPIEKNDDSMSSVDSQDNTRESTDSQRTLTSFDPHKMLRSFREVDWANVGDLLLSNFLIGAAFIVCRSTQTTFLSRKFDTSPVTNGYVISAGSAVSTLCGFFAGCVTRRFPNEFRLLKRGTITQFIFLTGMALSPNLESFVCLQMALSGVTAVMRVVSLNALVQRGGGKARAGAVMGVSQSVLALSRAVAPVISGAALDAMTTGPLYVGVVLTGCGACVLMSSMSVRAFLARYSSRRSE